MNIGNWVRRKGQRWHLVESVVAEDAVTRCGRRMDRVASRGELQVSEVMPLTRMIGQPQLCKAGCEREASRPTADDLAALSHEDFEAFIQRAGLKTVSDLPADASTANSSDVSRELADDDASTHDESEPA